jgi:hypothetical protein
MKTIAKYVSTGILAMTAVLLGGNAFAEDIYSQTFAPSPPIVGTTSTTGGGTWAGTNIIDLNGNTTGVDGAVSLPFSPQSGFVYDLTATINVTTVNGSWVGVGFLETNATYGFFGSSTTPTALRTIGWQTFAGPGANYPQTSNEVLIRLDTTGAQWTVAMYQGGVQMGSTFTYATNPTINHVGFVAEGPAVGSVSAFNLTANGATVIYSQTFAGSLVGTTPTTGSGTWAGTNIINLSGNTTGVDGAISLPFTPQSGFIYDLTATINVTTVNASWLGVGFLQDNSAYGWSSAALRTIGWQTWAGPGANYPQTSNEVLIRLDTSGALWTVAMFQGGVQMGSTFTYVTNPTINHVGFVAEGPAVGSVSAFKLTATAASVIYSQTFTGGAVPLAGTTSTSGGGTWAGDNIINLDGNSTAVGGAISLPFAPQSGFVYDLTATINVTTVNGSWVGVGFLETNATYGWSSAALRTADWQVWPQGFNANVLTSNEVLVRLDTTGSQWKTAMYQGGVQIGSTFTYATNPTITYVGFVAEGPAVGSVSAFKLTAVSNSPTFATWASTNAGGQAANLDWDNDGVSNGVEFFMDAAPGFTANPGLVGNTVTWPNGGNIPSSAYGTQFVVQTSSDLVTWGDVTEGDFQQFGTNTAGSLSYTLDPANNPGKQFVRLKVTPN